MFKIPQSPTAIASKWFFQTAGLAVAYWALGKLALFLAIPPGYATAVWPAAGIALAGVLLFGNRVWPGVLVGSFLANVSTAFDPTSLTAAIQSVALPAAIGAGAATQAVFGAFVVRRAVGFPSNFDRLREIVGTMVLGGPVACVLSPTIGVASLALAGSISGADVARSWGTWWLGDSIGVLVVIPLVSAWGMELHQASRKARVFVSLPLLVVMTMTVLGYLDARARELLRAQTEFERRAEIMARTLEESFRSKFEILEAITSLFETQREIDRAEFRRFVEPTFDRHPDLHGLSWNVVVAKEDRAEFEERVRAEGFPEFQITERSSEGSVVRAGVRDEYIVVTYIEPYQGNEEALGYDLASNPERAEALAIARDTGETAATSPIILVQESQEKPGVLFFAPVYRRGTSSETLDQRRRNLHSYVSGVFRSEPMVERALTAFGTENIDYRIVDTTELDDSRTLFGGNSSSDEENRSSLRLAWSTDLELAGRRWSVSFDATASYGSSAQWGKVWGILTGGLFLTSLLGAFLLAVAGRASAMERKNEELRLEIAERRRAKEALQKSQSRMVAAQRIARFAGWEWDRRTDMVWLSDEAYRIFGVANEARETSLDGFLERVHPDDRERVRRATEDAMAGEESYDVEYRIVRPDGEGRICHTVGETRRGEDGSLLGIQGTVHDITERRQAEQRIARFSSVLESSLNEIYSFDPETLLFIDVNRGARQNLGYSMEELSGLTPLDLKPEFTPESLSKLLEPLRSGDQEKVEFTTYHRRKDGTQYPVEVHLQLIGQGAPVFVAIVLDVTKRMASERALLHTQFSVDHAADGIFWIEEDGSISYVNETACAMIGRTRESLLTMSVFDIDPNYSKNMWPDFWQMVRKKSDLVIESSMCRKDGSLFPIEVAICYLEVEGVGKCFASARDTTERKKAEQERIKLDMKVREAQKLESLGVLAGGIAHDFNNLLVGVLGNAALAEERLKSGLSVDEILRDIAASAERAGDLASQLLAYSGRGRFVVEPIHLSDLVEEIAHLIEVSLSKKAKVKYELAKELSSIECDATQVRQVVMNLITNASEAIGDDSGVVTIRTGQVVCDAACLADTYSGEELEEGMYVFVEVADNGAGMDEDTQAKIFDPFFTTKFTGRGLGLAAVLGIVRSHRGAIDVRSEPDVGTAIKVLFPASKKALLEPQAPEVAEADWSGKGLVLLVDDEELVRNVASRMLTRFGFDVVVAKDGVEAVKVFRERSDEIVLVLLDLTMPVMGGKETLVELRRISRDVKVILSSGYVEQDSTSQSAGGKAAGFIQKPYRLDSLRDKIRQTLG